MKDITDPTELITKDHGTGKILLEGDGHEYRLESIHIKQDGTRDDKPSLLFSSVDLALNYSYVQCSIQTLNHNLKKLGYEVQKVT